MMDPLEFRGLDKLLRLSRPFLWMTAAVTSAVPVDWLCIDLAYGERRSAIFGRLVCALVAIYAVVCCIPSFRSICRGRKAKGRSTSCGAVGPVQDANRSLSAALRASSSSGNTSFLSRRVLFLKIRDVDVLCGHALALSHRAARRVCELTQTMRVPCGTLRPLRKGGPMTALAIFGATTVISYAAFICLWTLLA